MRAFRLVANPLVLPLALVVAAGLLSAASARAQKVDSARAAPTPTSPAPASGPTYALNPTVLLNLRALSPRVGISGYLVGRATRRNDSTSAAVTRARLTGMVAPLPYLGVRLQVEFASSQVGRTKADSSVAGFLLSDGYVELVPPATAMGRSKLLSELRPALMAGQFKVPFSLEYLTPISMIKTVSRSQVVDRISVKRDIGVQVQGGWSRYAALSLAVMNGEGANATSNPDNRALAVSRLTLTPVRFVAVSGKIANQGGDHAWGYDGRLLWQGLTLEGETVFRKRPTSSTVSLDAGGGYVLVAYRLRPWLEPLYKYDRYWDTRTTTRPGSVTAASTSGTWNVVGVNIVSVPEWLRFQLDWTRRDERPAPGRTNELVAQLVAIF